MASDIHALGVVLFEILTGHWPFEGASPLEVASRRLNGDAPSPRRYAAGLDRRWEYTILRCLNREPRQRPQSVAAVQELLTELPPILWLGRRAFIVGGAITTTTLLGVGAVMLTVRRRIPAVVECSISRIRRTKPILLTCVEGPRVNSYGGLQRYTV